jgi:chaperonin GroEL
MSDVLFTGEDARMRVLAGARQLYNAVKTTMGPQGNNVIIGKGPAPTVTHDGVTVAKSFNLDDDEGHRIGAELIKEAASKMNTAVGDGTTTVTVLTYHILSEANKLIAAGYNPMVLRKELEAAAKDALSRIKGQEVGDNNQILSQVAYISCGDESLGSLIADVVEEVGAVGAVTIEDSPELGVRAETTSGFTVPFGMQSPYFATAPGEALYKNPNILVLKGKVHNWTDLTPILETMMENSQKELVIFAQEFGPDVLANLVVNKVKGAFSTVAVTIPGYREGLYDDLAAFTGATMYGKATGMALDEFKMDGLGHAEKISVTQDKSVIVGLGADITNALKELDFKLKDGPDPEILERKAALQGKVAVIKVGGATETEIEEKRFRVEDAVAAVKAAMEEGVVPGGGVTLLEASRNLPNTTGGKLLKNALEQPFRILLENADLKPDMYIGQGLLKPGEGVDVNSGEIVKLLGVGIVDPAKVTREAIQNAVSVAGTAMTMGALIVPKKEEKKDEVAVGLGLN